MNPKHNNQLLVANDNDVVYKLKAHNDADDADVENGCTMDHFQEGK